MYWIVQISSSLLDKVNSNRSLVNVFVKKQATEEQAHDLLNFRAIGQKEFLLRTAYFTLKVPSVKAPNRRRRLQTFSEKKTINKKISQLEKDRRLILTAMKKKMQYSKKTGTPIERPGEQLLEYPLSLCDNEGNPRKGQKSYSTHTLETRYKEASLPVFTNSLPTEWRPECTIMEGMFLINTLPLGVHKTFADYAKFLMQRHIQPQFSSGSNEVHVIFDTPGIMLNTPTFFEQKRRDKTTEVTSQHYCDDINIDTKIPSGKWHTNFINCRECKRNLVIFLGNYFLKTAQQYLQTHHKLYVAGAFQGHEINTAWFVHGKNKAQPDPEFYCKAEETDTRIWLHVKQSSSTKMLILSPDTDVYHIGCPLQSAASKDIRILLSKLSSRELKFLSLSNLLNALLNINDPDLAHIPPTILPQVLQSLYVCTGCDYISFFSGIGKATFLRYFYQYATFITSGSDTSTPGTLANIGLTNNEYSLGFLSFVRLVGTAYYKLHSSGFDSPSPATYYRSLASPSVGVEEQHSIWLDNIRQNIWDRVKFENDMIPSDDALLLHWKRSCWVMHMWRQSDQRTMTLEPIEEYGWGLKDEELTIVWDTANNIRSVRDRVYSLLKGCKCSTGCATGRCGCKRKGANCSVGCQCLNCVNVKTTVQRNDEVTMITIQEEVSSGSYTGREGDDILDWVFGPENPQSDVDYSDTDSEDAD